MELKPGQLAAALACRCALSPATEHQVRRLAMQHRIFRVRAEPVVAVGGGSKEIWATLAALLEDHQLTAPEPSAETGMAAAHEHAVQNDTGLLPDPAQPNVAEAKQSQRAAATRAATAPALAGAGAGHSDGTVAGPSDAGEKLVGGAAAQGREPKPFTLRRGAVHASPAGGRTGAMHTKGRGLFRPPAAWRGSSHADRLPTK